jgi:hypothetical protein
MATTTLQLPVYIAYAVIAVVLTVVLAHILRRNGEVFLVDVFRDNPALARAVNHLLVVGFYLLNLGYACLLLKADPAAGTVAAVETLAEKLGMLLLSLGGMHMLNVYIFHRIRTRAREENPAPKSFLGQHV